MQASGRPDVTPIKADDMVWCVKLTGGWEVGGGCLVGLPKWLWLQFTVHDKLVEVHFLDEPASESFALNEVCGFLRNFLALAKECGPKHKAKGRRR
jgi:hypothetical protein